MNKYFSTFSNSYRSIRTCKQVNIKIIYNKYRLCSILCYVRGQIVFARKLCLVGKMKKLRFIFTLFLIFWYKPTPKKCSIVNFHYLLYNKQAQYFIWMKSSLHLNMVTATLSFSTKNKYTSCGNSLPNAKTHFAILHFTMNQTDLKPKN